MRRKQSPEKILAMTETANKPSRKTTEFSKFLQKDANSGSACIFTVIQRTYTSKMEVSKTSNSQ